ncbi:MULTISPECIES: sigma-70 family RNA polymerase sigma factor [Lachnospiraceae]|jgi:RNA polymerase sigma factor (sigma-70 family)|uniref:Sigma-70 family RNA polymerase sigma factor n=1 Tax=Blautia stercoris TaxID=871664 RepID=A0ABR7PBN4_9FIRM|nr:MULTISPECIES: sigma-70 family RNA polymerase sigma factor [Lachnospiraceae]MBC8628811.1 sigma-70 family RNA polymerase sigma factor [Blautia stercoris]RJU62834.1 DUF134 domain-containing protein [Coprococcus sp. AM27-12LB]
MPAEQGMERLIIEYGDTVLRMCFLYLKDYHLAEDAAQETFIKAMKHYDSFNRKSSEKTWLTRIAINCCKNIMRMNWFRLGRGQLEENIQTVATDPIEKVLERDGITRAIQSMEVQDRELIILYYYQELSMKEIAQVIGKSENVTIQRVNRARKKLKKILMEVGYGL